MLYETDIWLYLLNTFLKKKKQKQTDYFRLFAKLRLQKDLVKGK